MSVEVCPICDIAGCRHIRERAAPDLIPKADAELAVALAYQRATSEITRLAQQAYDVYQCSHMERDAMLETIPAFLALAPADALVEVQALRAGMSEYRAKWIKEADRNNELSASFADDVAKLKSAEAEVARLKGVLNHIDALDPEGQVGGVSADAARGLVNTMGNIARAALTTPEKGMTE